MAKPAVALNTIPGYAIHQVEFANDGFYGNERSWIGLAPSGWLKIDLGRTASINRITFGRDRVVGHDDRDPGQFTISVALSENVYANGDDSNDKNEYRRIFDSATVGFSGSVNGTETVQAAFGPVDARYADL